MTRWRTIVAPVMIALAVVAAGCGGSDSESKEVVLVTHDSFAIPKDVKAAFEQESGLKLRILQGGDAGEMLNRALLTKGNPQGDAIFGVDNNLLSRAVGAGLLEQYEPEDIVAVDGIYRLDPTSELTPIDHGDVCLNIDKRWFSSRGIEPPASLDDLVKPAYRKLLVVENPATSTPGLAFMMATIDRFGETPGPNTRGWKDYWRRLRDNGVLVVDGWTEAYTGQFSGAGGSKGKRPIVVSYATSPPAEVMFAKTPPKTAPTAAVASTCFRQVELAGVLAGAKNQKGARALIDFMLTEKFQRALPESMFVLPVREGTPLPQVFRRYAAFPTKPFGLSAEEIGANRDRWIDEWTQVVLR